MKFVRSAQKGFTLVEIMIVVAIIGILIAIAVPSFVRARTQSRMRACQENLTKIDGAKEQWALENNKTTTDTPVWTDLINTSNAEKSYLKKSPVCPSNGTYAIGAVSNDPTCTVSGHAINNI